MNKFHAICLALFVCSILLITHLASTSSLSNAPRIKTKDGASTNWAGYAVETSLASPQKAAVTDVKGSWTVPSVVCSTTLTAYSSFWIGIDGYASKTVEQIGTDSDCSSGSPTYYAWYEMYPKFPVNLKLIVSPGDVMTADVSYVSKDTFKLTITDTTTGKSYSTTQKLPSASRSSAEWIAEAPSSSRVLPLADFASVQFSAASATINGNTGPISSTSWQHDAITMVTSSGTAKATPSALSSNGDSFSVVWQNAGP